MSFMKKSPSVNQGRVFATPKFRPEGQNGYAAMEPNFHPGTLLGSHLFGSGDGEREASMTRQMPYEPLPASVLLNKAAVRRGRLRAC